MKKINKIGLLAGLAIVGFTGQSFAATAILTAKTVVPEKYSTSTVANTAVAATATSGAAAAGIFAWEIPVAGATISNILIGDSFVLSVANGKFDATSMTNNQPVLYNSNIATATAFTGGSTCSLNAARTALTCTISGADTAVNAITSISLSNAALFDLSATVPGTDVTVDMVVNRPSVLAGGAAVEIHNSGATKVPEVAFTTSLGLINTGSLLAASAVTAQVSDSFKQITSGATGTVAITATGVGINYAPSAATLLAAKSVNGTGKYLMTLSGVPTAATKVVSATNTTVGVTQSDNAGTAIVAASQTAGSTFYLDGLGNAYGTFTKNAAINLIAADFVITTDGVNAIGASNVTMTLSYLPGGTDLFRAHTLLSSVKMVTINRNGSAFSLNRMAPNSTVRISNRSAGNAPGTLTVTAFDAAGNSVAATGTALIPLPTVIASGKTVTINGATFSSEFGATAAVYNVVVASDDILASHRQATAAGLTTTVYRSGANAGGL